MKSSKVAFCLLALLVLLGLFILSSPMLSSKAAFILSVNLCSKLFSFSRVFVLSFFFSPSEVERSSHFPWGEGPPLTGSQFPSILSKSLKQFKGKVVQTSGSKIKKKKRFTLQKAQRKVVRRRERREENGEKKNRWTDRIRGVVCALTLSRSKSPRRQKLLQCFVGLRLCLAYFYAGGQKPKEGQFEYASPLFSIPFWGKREFI